MTKVLVSARRTLWACGALAGAVFLLYGQVIGHEFVGLDDQAYIAENAHVLHGLTWEGVRWAFTTHHEANWHPLTWLSHMADTSLFGTGPAGPHAVNVALHAANAVLLFLAFASMTEAFWPSLLVAALFAVHPLRVESVAWAAERKDVLSGLFFMLTLLAYASWARRGGAGRYALVVASMALGLMAKPMLVTLPVALLLLDAWPLCRLGPRRTMGSLVVEKIPLIALSAASCAATLAAQAQGGITASLHDVPLGSRVANALASCAAYLGAFVWPAGLTVYYPHPALAAGGAPSGAATWAGCAVLAVGTLAALWKRHELPYLPVGWLWYLVTLLPVIGILQVGMQARADRYTYVPLIGVYVIVAWGSKDLATRRPAVRPVLAAVLALAVAAFAGVTWVQIGSWRDTPTLFDRALRLTTGNFLVHNNLAAYYLDRGELDEARDHLEHALAARPDYAFARNNLGIVYKRRGDLSRAREEFETAQRLDPNMVEATSNLAGVYALLDDPSRAAALYEAAIGRFPDDGYLHRDYGNLLAAQGMPDRAAAQLTAALRAIPGDAATHSAMGKLLAGQGRMAEAEARFRSAAALDPGLADARNNLGTLEMRQGRLTEAEAEYRAALRAKPDLFEAAYNLGSVLRKQGKLAPAVAQYEEALKLRADARVHQDAAAVLVQLGRLEEAVAHFREVLRLDPDRSAVAREIERIERTIPGSASR